MHARAILFLAAALLAPRAASAGGGFAGRAGRAVLRLHLEEGERLHRLSATPLPHALRRFAHRSRAEVETALAEPANEMRVQELKVHDSGLHLKRNGMSVDLGVDAEHQWSTIDRFDARGDHVSTTRATLRDSGGHRSIRREEIRRAGSILRYRTMEGFEAPRDLTLPSGLQISRGSWVVVQHRLEDEGVGRSAQPHGHRYAMWSWKESARGRTRVKTEIDERDFEVVRMLRFNDGAQPSE